MKKPSITLRRKAKTPPQFTFETIAEIHSCFKEKFGIPRQPRLAPHAPAIVKFKNQSRFREALEGLDEFSHVWLITVFHDQKDCAKWKPKVRPPRMGGKAKVGVFASRSPHRPNPIALSPVKLVRVDLKAKGGPELHVQGVDLLDGTPVLDIKPYVPYGDSIPEALSAWAKNGPHKKHAVKFSPEAGQKCMELEKNGYPDLRLQLEEILALDPRPGHQTRLERTPYAARLFDFDVHWQVENGICTITEIKDLR